MADGSAPTSSSGLGHLEPHHRVQRTRIARSAALLLLGTVALAVLFLLYRDGRRQQRAWSTAQRYAAVMAARERESEVLPLALKPPVSEEATEPDEFSNLTLLSREHALVLRGLNGPVIAARSARIDLLLRPDGRALVWFDRGTWRPEWVTESEFARHAAAQLETLRQLRTPSESPTP
jgi:hypothetical protein